MPAYVIVDITATEPVGYEEYKKLRHATPNSRMIAVEGVQLQ